MLKRIAILLFLGTLTAGAQTTALDYKLSELQYYKLKSAVSDAQLKEQVYIQALQQYKAAVDAANAQAAQIAVENKWPKDIQFDIKAFVAGQPAFHEPAKQEAKKP